MSDEPPKAEAPSSRVPLPVQPHDGKASSPTSPPDTLYELFRVDPGASSDDLGEAYLRLRDAYHPRANAADPLAAEIVRYLDGAYAVLIDPERRNAYDASVLAGNGLGLTILDSHGGLPASGSHGYTPTDASLGGNGAAAPNGGSDATPASRALDTLGGVEVIERRAHAIEFASAPSGDGGPDGARPPSRDRRRRNAYAERDLMAGSIPKNLAFLAWPQIAEGVLNVFDQVWDLFLAGRGFGFRAIAGIGVAQQYIQLARTGRMGLDVAMRAMIARAVGAGDIALANHVALQAFTINTIFSLLIATLGVLFTEPMLRVIGISDAVVALAAGYMRWQFVGTLMLTFRNMSGAALQASGDTLTPMKAAAVARIIDLCLAPLLMFGWLGLPSFGVAGVAVANVLSQSVGSAMNFRNLFIGSSRLHLTLRGYRLDLPLMWRIIRLGAPASVNSIERSAAQMILVIVMAPFGDVALASYALTQRTQMVVNLGTQGLGNASGIIAGQNLGAGNVSRARETVLWALGYVSLIKLLLVSVLFVLPSFFLSIFNSDPELLHVGTGWLRIMLLGYFAMGPVQVLMQSFQTAGDTVMPMFTTMVAMWAVEVPFAIVLSGVAQYIHPFGLTLPLPTVGNLGHYGVAWAITIAAFFRMAVYLPYYVWGPWTKKQVLGGVQRQGVGTGRMH